MTDGWPSWARPATPEEIATARHLERVYTAYDTLKADVILLISALQQIEHHTADEHAANCARIGLGDYAAARKEAEQKQEAA